MVRDFTSIARSRECRKTHAAIMERGDHLRVDLKKAGRPSRPYLRAQPANHRFKVPFVVLTGGTRGIYL